VPKEKRFKKDKVQGPKGEAAAQAMAKLVRDKEEEV
jgi:hypothetical protein